MWCVARISAVNEIVGCNNSRFTDSAIRPEVVCGRSSMIRSNSSRVNAERERKIGTPPGGKSESLVQCVVYSRGISQYFQRAQKSIDVVAQQCCFVPRVWHVRQRNWYPIAVSPRRRPCTSLWPVETQPPQKPFFTSSSPHCGH